MYVFMYVCTLFERYPFRIPSIEKWYPFNIPSLELCISLISYCKCTFFKIWMCPKPLRSQRFQDFFTAINTSNWQIILPFQILQLVKSLPIHIPEARSLKWELPRICHYKLYLPGIPTNLYWRIVSSFPRRQDWDRHEVISWGRLPPLKRSSEMSSKGFQDNEGWKSNQSRPDEKIRFWITTLFPRPSHSSPLPSTQLIYKARLPSMRYNFYGNGNEEVFFFALTFWFYYIILFSSGTISLKLLHRSFYNPITDFN